MKSGAARLGLNLLVWVGSAMLAASAAIHFHLWDSEGYRHIPTIGPLFLAQAIVGALLAIATAIFRRLILVVGSAGLAISSIGGLLISIWWGLFGWQESSSAPYVGIAFTVEAIAAVLLGTAAALMAWPWVAGMRSRTRTEGGRSLLSGPEGVVAISAGTLRRAHPAAGSKRAGTSSGPAN